MAQSLPEKSVASLPALRLNPGEMASRFHAMDWSHTPLGAIGDWPQSLRVAVGICLNSRFPMFVWWGQALTNIYNDAYVPILGNRHPAALGRPAQEFWGDIWPTILPQVEAVMRRGESTWNERAELIMQRHGYPEVTSFTWSYSPIIDELGGVGGLYCACIEETPRMLTEQQRDLLLSQVQSERTRLGEAFEKSPAFMGILNGPEHHVEYFNERFYQLVGRRGFVGKTVRAALPEVVSQGFVDILDRVYRSGEPYVGTAVRMELRRRPDRGLEEAFVDFVYQPLRALDGSVTGILVHGVDITDQHRRAARDRFLLALDEAIRPLTGHDQIVDACTRLLGEHMSVDRCVFIGVTDDDDTFKIAGQYNRQIPDIAGQRRLSDFGQEARRLLREDEPYVVEDIDTHVPPPLDLHAYRRVMIQALVCVPLLKDRRMVAAMAVSQSTPRIWRPEEVALVRQAANRCDESLERARVARQLLESEARFRNMSDYAPVMIWLTGPRGEAEYLNKRWFEFTGQAPEQAMGFGWLDAIHPDDAAEAEDGFMAANRRREPFSLEYRLRRRDGEYRWCVDAATPRLGAGGGFSGYIGSVVDITERKRVEEALAAEKDVLELVATGAPLPMVLDEIARTVERQSSDGMLCAVMTLEEEGGNNLVIGAAPHLPQAYCDAVPEQPFDAHIGPRDEADPRWQEFGLLAGAHGLHVAHAGRIAAGEGYLLGIVAVFYRELRAVSDRDVDLARLAARLAGIVIDKHRVDHRLAQALQAEQEARSDAERAGRVKDEFLATLSHELRTPLNAILGWVSVLKNAAASAVDLSQGVEVIERNARSQARIIDDLLDMSAIISGKVRLEVRGIDLVPIVTDAVETARLAADAKRIRIQTILDSKGAVSVLGDADRLHQILWNLLSNAVKFTAREGHIRVALTQADSNVEISVSDNGEGIDRAFVPFVFDRFRQADASTTRRHGGLGLGLSIVKKLAELHGGSVRVSSDGLGRGASFTLSLPLAAIRQADGDGGGVPAEQNSGGDDPGASIEISGLRILVVDDEPDARDLVRQVLEARHASVATAGSAEDALALMRAGRFDVLVSDIGMPDDDGYALLRRVRAMGAEAGGDTPAVALTAYARPEDRVKAIRAGFHMHLAKPVEAAELVATIASLARRIR